MTLRTAVIASIAVAVIVAACGGDGDDTPPASPTLVATPTAILAAETMCGAGPATMRGTVETELLTEISGLVASRSQEDVLWAHNDSGDVARVFAMAVDGRHLGSYTLAGVEAIDWEDMAIGPGPVEGEDYLYLGDIGDNPAERPEVIVYRVLEPDAGSSGDITDVETLVLRYPDRPHDAEVLLVDPLDGAIYIITKEIDGGPSTLFRTVDFAGPDTILEEVATVDFKALKSAVEPPDDASPLVLGIGWLPTGGDVAPDRSMVAIRTYETVWVWQLQGGAALSEAFTNEPCEASSAIEPQGEAIAFDATSAGFYTASEGVNPPIYYTGQDAQPLP
ncbi:MAG: hypothetical protein IH865_04040 [Chloroflexi bacterium]|nr:hypothetical protein [Chloroflexota bacterium]